MAWALPREERHQAATVRTAAPCTSLEPSSLQLFPTFNHFDPLQAQGASGLGPAQGRAPPGGHGCPGTPGGPPGGLDLEFFSAFATFEGRRSYAVGAAVMPQSRGMCGGVCPRLSDN